VTERGAVGLAALAHLALVAALSVGLARSLPADLAAPDITPVEFVEIGAEATVPRPPVPAVEAAPRDPGLPPPADTVAPLLEPAPALPESPPVADTAAQDAIAETVAPAPKARAPRRERAPDRFDPGAMAALIDQSLPDAATRPRDPAPFAKSMEQAIPKGARVSARQIATLEQAIRAQIAPCWNPPVGGADVAAMTAVLRIRLMRDGTVASPPEFVSQTGATAGNQAYARAFVDSARRAVLRCTPLTLPADLYAQWREFELNFDPRLMT
jgi:hypothetical protein